MSFPYGAKVMLDYLVEQMPDDVKISSDVPKTVPAKLVTITQVPAGGHEKPRHFAWRRFIFRCWDADEITTAALSETVRKHVVESASAGIGFRKIVVVGEPGRFDDPQVSKPSFQLTVDALMRATFTDN